MRYQEGCLRPPQAIPKTESVELCRIQRGIADGIDRFLGHKRSVRTSYSPRTVPSDLAGIAISAEIIGLGIVAAKIFKLGI